ncbi:MAG: hypothetical protein AAFV80_18350 [Bacteroidota bacterium]
MFFVGYLEGMPSGLKSFIRNLIIGLFVLAIGGGVWFALGQDGYTTGQFELGNPTEVSGKLQYDPVPSIRLLTNPETADMQTIPLVSSGKFGALKLLLGYEHTLAADNRNFENTWVTLKGALVYNDGKALMELSDLENALVDYKPMTEIQKNKVEANQFKAKPTQKTLRGEIIDPKCYFGAMNPGYGKVHRSCAIMCIRGGIPPVLHVVNETGGNDYYLIRDLKGKRLNQRILDFVGVPVAISGEVSTADDWKVLRFDPETAIQRVD